MIKKVITSLINNNKKNSPKGESSKKIKEIKKESISASLEYTLNTFKDLYSYPTNTDVSIRYLQINGLEKQAVIFFISTITDSQLIEDHIIRPLLQNKNTLSKVEDIISAPTIASKQKINDIVNEINNGNVAVFIEKMEKAFIVSANKFEGRSVEKPENEVVLKGPKEAFVESAQTNISLIRKKIKDENLVFESTVVSKRSKNEALIVYIKDLTNEDLIQDVKNRLNRIDVDSVQNLAMLQQFIEERQLSLFPSILYTERPDRATVSLENGYVILLMNNEPAVLVLPATFWSFFHTSEDNYLRFVDGNFTRIIRLFAIFVTLFTSALYIAVTEFHAEMLPSELVLAVAATREKVPFPPLIEIIVMELSFELIREAGLRVPAPIGPTIGIVGALILGQAAVQANIVSPIVVIAVALGGLSSFAIGDLSLNFAVRILRFAFIFSAAIFGLYGMLSTLLMILFYIVSLKSFGIPYLSPLTPTYVSAEGTIFRKLLKNEIFRPGYLKPKDITKKKERSL